MVMGCILLSGKRKTSSTKSLRNASEKSVGVKEDTREAWEIGLARL